MTHNIQRLDVIESMFRSGHTMQEIGLSLGITRQYVCRMLDWRCVKRTDGGQHVRTANDAAKRLAQKNKRALQKYGCDYAQYRALSAGYAGRQSPVRAFIMQRRNAGQRGIAWQFTLWDWWCVWQESGKWDKRGRGFGYVMARKGDTGPYAKGNVYITTSSQNIKDSFIFKPAHMRQRKVQA